MITFPGFLLAYESGRDEPADEEEERRLPQLEVGQAARGDGARARGPRDEPAAALHGGEPRQGARGPRHRPPVHLRLDPRHDRRPRLRLQEGHGARADASSRSRSRSCSRGTSDGSSTTTSRRGWRTTSTGSPPATRRASTWLAPLLLRRRRHPGCTRSSPSISTRSTRARVNSIEIGGPGSCLRVGRYGPYLERGERARERPRRPARRTSSRSRRRRSCSPRPSERPLARRAPETGREIVVKTGRYGPYVTEVLPEGDEGKPRTASLFTSMSPETVTLEDAVRLLSLPRDARGARRRGDPRLERPLRAVREEGQRDALARVARSSC